MPASSRECRCRQQQDPNAIVLPQRAIQDQQGKNYVWIVDADGKAQQHDVRMGLRIGERLAGAAGTQGRRPGDRRRRTAPEARHAGQSYAVGAGLRRQTTADSSRPARQRGPGAAHDRLLHRPPDLLDGAGDHHHHRRRSVADGPADRPLSADHAAHDRRLHPLPRRRCRHHRSSRSPRRSSSRSTACRT